MKKIKMSTTMPYLKCVKAIESCPGLEVGDLLWGGTRDIWPGGYEYATYVRREDGHVFQFRVDHLDECFEIVDVEDERWL